MSTFDLYRPGMRFGRWAERIGLPAREASGLRALVARLVASAVMPERAHLARALAARERFSALPQAALNVEIAALRASLHREISAQNLADALGLCAAVAERTIGKRPYDVQVRAAWGLLQGRAVEMQTGEGKTLAAGIAAGAAALTGVPVHVITSNDYLVARDAGQLRPLFEALGLALGAALESDAEDLRRVAYRADVTYVNNKQVVFDYLLDREGAPGAPSSLRLRISELLVAREQDTAPAAGLESIQRGLYFAIVDEADGVLIDDVRTPLVISRRAPTESATVYPVALGLASRLREREHFYRVQRGRAVALTPGGIGLLAELCAPLVGVWAEPRRRQSLVEQALTATRILELHRDYLVRDGRIVLIDEGTGRAVPGRMLRNGLHQMLESKERCELSDPSETLAQLTYRRFFARYLKLCGTSGTLFEQRGELLDVYGLRTLRVPTHKPTRHTQLPGRWLPDAEAHRAAIVAEAAVAHARGQPILICTRTVAQTRALCAALDELGLAHAALHAENEAEEAAVVARAGQAGAITVATNMAGRGTDIELGDGVAALGGLYVLITFLSESRRGARQLRGRCARQGQPGCSGLLLSRDDEVLAPALRRGLGRLTGRDEGVSWLGRRVIRNAQRRLEQEHARERRLLLLRDAQLDDLLAFAGEGS